MVKTAFLTKDELIFGRDHPEMEAGEMRGRSTHAYFRKQSPGPDVASRVSPLPAGLYYAASSFRIPSPPLARSHPSPRSITSRRLGPTPIHRIGTPSIS